MNGAAHSTLSASVTHCDLITPRYYWLLPQHPTLTCTCFLRLGCVERSDRRLTSRCLGYACSASPSQRNHRERSLSHGAAKGEIVNELDFAAISSAQAQQ